MHLDVLSVQMPVLAVVLIWIKFFIFYSRWLNEFWSPITRKKSSSIISARVKTFYWVTEKKNADFVFFSFQRQSKNFDRTPKSINYSIDEHNNAIIGQRYFTDKSNMELSIEIREKGSPYVLKSTPLDGGCKPMIPIVISYQIPILERRDFLVH